jgi:hypothetical protein
MATVERGRDSAASIDELVAGVRCTIDIEPPELVAGAHLVLPGRVGPQDQEAAPELKLRVQTVPRQSSNDGGEPGAEPRYVLLDAGRPVAEPCSGVEVLRALEHHLRIWVSVLAPHCLLVHAGVVVWDGRAVVLPGPSGSGKSSLVLALVRAGAAFSSDDVAVIDPDGQVWPWPRPLRLRGTHEIEHPSVPPAPTGSADVGTIVFARFRPAEAWVQRELGPATTAARLLGNTPCARTRPQLALSRCAELARHALGYEVDRGEAADSAPRILALHQGLAAAR